MNTLLPKDYFSFDLGNDENWIGKSSQLPEDIEKYIKEQKLDISEREDASLLYKFVIR